VGQGGKVLQCETGIRGSAGPTFRNFRSSSNLPEIRRFGLGRKVPNSDIAFGNGRVTFR